MRRFAFFGALLLAAAVGYHADSLSRRFAPRLARRHGERLLTALAEADARHDRDGAVRALGALREKLRDGGAGAETWLDLQEIAWLDLGELSPIIEARLRGIGADPSVTLTSRFHARLLLARQLRGAGRALEARAILDDLCAAEVPDWPALVGWARLERARLDCDQGDLVRCHDQAVELIGGHRAVDPDVWAEASMLVARVARERGDESSAAGILSGVAATSRGVSAEVLSRARLALAKTELSAGHPDVALPLYRVLWDDARSSTPTRFEAGLRIAQVLRALGHPEDARRIQRKALALEVPERLRRSVVTEIGIPEVLDPPGQRVDRRANPPRTAADPP